MLLYALFLVCTRIREENTTFIPKFLVFCLTICKIDCDKSGETGEKGITKRLLVRWLKKIEKNTEKDSALHSHISLSSQAKFWDHLLLLLIISNSSYRLSHGFLSKWPYSLVQLSVLVTLGCYKKKIPQTWWIINNRHLFLIVLEVESPRSRHQWTRVLMRAIFLVHLFSMSHGRRDKGVLGLSLIKATNPIHRSFIFMT